MKLNKLTLNNFKFFLGKQEINFNQKNLLLYGENGSGKSSIFWALYTILQSSMKDNNNISKYFDISNPANLVNKFANDNDKSSLTIELIDDEVGSESFEISETDFQTNNSKKTTIIESNQASDFINNRLLTRFYNFRNSEPIDLFPIFAKDLFQFINFNMPYKNNNNNASDWWKYIKNGLNPRPHMHTPEYKDFNKSVGNFNIELRKYLSSIIELANNYLQDKFNEKYQISFSYSESTYDDFKDGGKSRNHQTKAPKIILDIKDLHGKLSEAKKNILRPHTFLNEARLTAIALSIRFAILDEKLKNPDSCKLLVIDDLLISLDMSNRDKVLNILINEFKDYQILFMTHDRMFFNIMKNRILQSDSKSEWKMKELYENIKDGIPIPFLTDLKDYLDIAVSHLANFDYPACANYLRKECERLLKEFLPQNLIKSLSDGKIKKVQLDTFIVKFMIFYKELFVDNSEFQNLREYKDLLLNPLSHDNIDTPIYKCELLEIILLIKKLKKLEKKILISLLDEDNSFCYISVTDTDNVEWIYKIKPKEKITAYKNLNGVWRVNNPDCLFIERKSSAITEDIDKKYNLEKGYKQIRHFLKLPVITDAELNIELLSHLMNSKKEIFSELLSI